MKETILPGLLAGDEKASFKIYCYALDDGTEEIELPGLEGEDDGEGKEESAEHAEPGHVEEPKAAEGKKCPIPREAADCRLLGATVASGEKEEVEVEEGDEIDMAELGDINEMIMQALAENETLAIWAIEKIEKPTDAPKDTAQLIDKIIEDIEVNVQGGDDDEKEEAEEEEKE